MKYLLILFVFSLAGQILLSADEPAQTYTYPQLVKRMTDLRQLAQLPPAGEKTSLASSYDRASQYDAGSDKYINWGANADGRGPAAIGPDVHVADIQGPGCIWRIWSAHPSIPKFTGHFKIYLDGSTTPTIDLPLLQYLDGSVPPFNRPNLVYEVTPRPGPETGGGYNNFTPISFAKSCRIVADKWWGNYYQFTYTQFPAGTVVPTFTMTPPQEDLDALDQANQILGQCGQNPMGDTGSTTDSNSIVAEAGKATAVDDLSGAGAITALKVKFDLPPDPEAQRTLLRQLTVSITWDGSSTPAVWSPVGDFFGYIGGADRTYKTLPVGRLEDGTFYCYWYMPYGKSAHIEMGNDGSEPVNMTWQVSHVALNQPIGGLARFHAKWHRDAFLPQRADRAPDWTLVTTQGQGRYVGTNLHIWNPMGGWWGEGDDKFFVDGEKFPSSFGTGTEDYFGYAWGLTTHFSQAYHSQTMASWTGHTNNNRWHISDSVPFQNSLEACLEKYFPSKFPDDRGAIYAAEAYWYLDASGTDAYGPVALADRVGYWTKPVTTTAP
jgi:hypothetical protein